MKKITLLLLFFSSMFAFSQVGIVENFDSGTTLPIGWTETGGKTIAATESCAGNSIRDNLYNFSITGTLVTPNQVAASNGTDMEVSFDYKIENWNSTVAAPAGWGNIQVQYSVNNGTSWTTFLTINDENHVVANTCATMMGTVTGANLPLNSDVKVRFLFTWVSGDYDIYIDNFSATQVSSTVPNCDATLTQTENVNLDGVISWSSASGGPTGYDLTVGSTSGGSDILATTDVGNVLTYDVGDLNPGTTYYVTIVPYNAIGDATGCVEQTFTTLVPPPNDDCANATPLTVGSDLSCSDPVSGTTTFSSQSLAGCLGTANDDVWYSFVATGTIHSIIVNNTGGNSDIVTQVFDACGGNSLVCQDTPNSPTTVTGLTAGETYYFRIYTWSSTASVSTSFDVCVGTPPPPPTNDTCEGALTLNESVDSSCANAVSGTTVDAFGSASGTCSATGKDVWYTFTPLTTGNYNFTVSEVTDYGFSSTYVTLYSGDCGETTQIGTSCTTTSISNVALTASTTYYVVVRTTSATTGVDFNLCAYPTPPPPANDSCADALTLTESADSSCENAVSGTTVSATPSAAGTCSATGKDVWYTFTPLTTADYNFSVSEVTDYGSSSTYVTLYSGDCGDTTQIGTSCTTTSIINVALTASTTYYVVVRTTSTTAGVDFNLCAYPTPPPPANDTCAGALPLTESADNSCDNAVSGTTVDAFPSASGTCSTTGKDVWYTFTPSQTTDYIFGVTETQDFGSSSTYMQVYSGSCGETTQVGTGCFSSSTTLALTAATQYYVVVRSTSSTAGVNFDLCAYPAPPPPANDDLCDATPLTMNTNSTGGAYYNNSSTLETSEVGGSCWFLSNPPSNSVWFSFVAPASGEVRITTVYDDGTLVDTQLALYSLGGVCSDLTTLTQLACDEDDDDNVDPDAGLRSLLDFSSLTAGQTYYVQVDGYAANVGTFDLGVFDLTTLSVDSSELNAFSYFPNPVKNTLNLKAQSNIQNVSIYNMLGQEVLRTSPNSLNSELNMASLQTGAYFVKVTINDAVETIRVIKQ